MKTKTLLAIALAFSASMMHAATTVNNAENIVISSPDASAPVKPSKPNAGATTYNNAQYGYSLLIPAGFKAQNNDAALEEENGGKLFMRGNPMKGTKVSTINTATGTTDDVKSYIETSTLFLNTNPDDGDKEISKVITDTSAILKYVDSAGVYHVICYIAINDNAVVNLTLYYEDAAQFNAEADKIIASLKQK